MATSPLIVPVAERYRQLRAFMNEYVDIVAELRNTHAGLAQQWPQFFLFLLYPWLADQIALAEDQRVLLNARKLEIQRLGFDGDLAKRRLEEILANDRHLAACCPSLLHLANFLDTFFITASADAKRQGAPRERLESAYEEFESLTYHQGRFKRVALSHLFNFDIDGNSAIFEGGEGMNIRVERLDGATIPRILGESGFQAFLHPPGIGNCFVVEEEGATAADDLTWLMERRLKALAFAQVLQYFQDGVTHVGYSVPVFQPNWVNQIRRAGLFFLGEPRRIPYDRGEKLYKLSAHRINELAKWWKAATTRPIIEYIANKKGKLRQAIYRAGEYYESTHQHSDNVERLLGLAVSLESLFSPTDKGELKFRISQSAAQFIGANPDEREQIFKSIRKMYDRRSQLVHGTYDVQEYDEGRFVTAAELDEWAAYIRRAILGFLTLYFRGEQGANRDPILERIAASNFDQLEGEALRKEADIESFFAELAAAQTGPPQEATPDRPSGLQ